MASSILSKIGSGVTFPIELTPLTDEQGNIITTFKTDEEGNPVYDNNGEPLMVPVVGWYPTTTPNLIKHNLTSLFVYQLGERFRQESFGSRLWEAIEEPNTQVLKHMMDLFIKSSISRFEPRIRALDINLERQNEKLSIHLHFMVGGSRNVEKVTLEYNSITTESYAY